MPSNAEPDRYHLLLTPRWSARHARLVGQRPRGPRQGHADRRRVRPPGARVTLTDELTGERLTEWLAPA
ncbi:hypothetical protein ACF1BB_27090 [Streptomyces griseoluteus]|uniref:hypothetical protein n=1 Tax=Streptomyces griseoluteus TaxID=29306 RepID=UPI0037006FD0